MAENLLLSPQIAIYGEHLRTCSETKWKRANETTQSDGFFLEDSNN